MIRLYPNCIAVMGFKNIVFYDIEQQCYKRFPKSDFFDKNSVELKHFDLKQVNETGLQLLKKHKLIMETKEQERDSRLKQSSFYKWKHPSLITNAIIELSKCNELICPFAFSKLLQHLDVFMCRHVLLHLKSFVPVKDLKNLIEFVHLSEIHSFQLILPYELEYDTDDVGTFIMQQAKLNYMIFEGATVERNLENKLFFTKGKLKSGNIKHPDQFSPNLFLFSEAQYHHTYFNRKLFIGEKGEIKNAPECEEIHGWIQMISDTQQLEQIIKTATFQKLWLVNKERSEVCKDCEYRYMCVDNRVPYATGNGYWYHETMCNYNPYEGEWDHKNSK